MSPLPVSVLSLGILGLFLGNFGFDFSLLIVGVLSILVLQTLENCRPLGLDLSPFASILFLIDIGISIFFVWGSRVNSGSSRVNIGSSRGNHNWFLSPLPFLRVLSSDDSGKGSSSSGYGCRLDFVVSIVLLSRSLGFLPLGLLSDKLHFLFLFLSIDLGGGGLIGIGIGGINLLISIGLELTLELVGADGSDSFFFLDIDLLLSGQLSRYDWLDFLWVDVLNFLLFNLSGKSLILRYLSSHNRCRCFLTVVLFQVGINIGVDLFRCRYSHLLKPGWRLRSGTDRDDQTYQCNKLHV